MFTSLQENLLLKLLLGSSPTAFGSILGYCKADPALASGGYYFEVLAFNLRRSVCCLIMFGPQPLQIGS